MDLWIRSQDRQTIMKFEGVIIGDLSDWYENSLSETMDNIISDGGGYFINALISNRPLGYYKTEERALEILDEIRNYKDKLEKAYFLGMTESEFVSSIYEMPNE